MHANLKLSLKKYEHLKIEYYYDYCFLTIGTVYVNVLGIELSRK